MNNAARKQKILITGACGFIGHAMLEFIRRKHPEVEVFGFDQHVIYRDIRIFQGDLTDKKTIKKVISFVRPDIIFHLAGGRFTDEDDLRKGNLLTTQNLCDSILDIPDYHPRLVIPGSAAEYGQMPQGKDGIDENDQPKPQSMYGKIKLEQTNLALSYVERGIEVVVGRVFNITGSGLSPALAAGRFSEQIINIEKGRQDKVITTKNLSGKRDFLDVQDVCSALFLIGQNGQNGEIYNISSNQYTPIRNILDKLLKFSKAKNIKVAEEKDSSMPSFDIKGSNEKLKSVGSWDPQVEIDQSLEKTLESFRSYRHLFL